MVDKMETFQTQDYSVYCYDKLSIILKVKLFRNTEFNYFINIANSNTKCH